MGLWPHLQELINNLFEITKISYGFVHKMLLAYFHKLSKIAYRKGICRTYVVSFCMLPCTIVGGGQMVKLLSLYHKFIIYNPA